MAVAIGAGGLDEAVDLGVGQILPRPHFGVLRARLGGRPGCTAPHHKRPRG
jgi:hypothetical protein